MPTVAEHVDLAVSLTRERARAQLALLREKKPPVNLLHLAREAVSVLEHLDGDPRFSVLVRVPASEAEQLREQLEQQGLVVEEPPLMEFLAGSDDTVKLAI